MICFPPGEGDGARLTTVIHAPVLIALAPTGHGRRNRQSPPVRNAKAATCGPTDPPQNQAHGPRRQGPGRRSRPAESDDHRSRVARPGRHRAEDRICPRRRRSAGTAGLLSRCRGRRQTPKGEHRRPRHCKSASRSDGHRSAAIGQSCRHRPSGLRGQSRQGEPLAAYRGVTDIKRARLAQFRQEAHQIGQFVVGQAVGET